MSQPQVDPAARGRCMSRGHKVSPHRRLGAQHRVHCTISCCGSRGVLAGTFLLSYCERTGRSPLLPRGKAEGKSLGVNGKDTAVSVDPVLGQISSRQPATRNPRSSDCKSAPAPHSLEHNPSHGPSVQTKHPLHPNSIASSPRLFLFILRTNLHNCKHFFNVHLIRL